MPIFWLMCAIVSVLLLMWGMVRLLRKSGKAERFQKDKIGLLAFARKRPTRIPKLNVILDLEISPNYLKELIESCKSDGFMTETEKDVKITDFGKEYYDRFIYYDQLVSGKENGNDKI